MALVLILLGLVLAGCGAGESESNVTGPFEAGELDPYGCPFVDPVPWEGVEAHREVCGAGCEPFAAWAPGADNSLVACVADEVPRPDPGAGENDVVWCMLHPVDGREYCRGTPQSAYPMFYLCWSSNIYGEEDGVPGYPSTAPPECLERSQTRAGRSG